MLLGIMFLVREKNRSGLDPLTRDWEYNGHGRVPEEESGEVFYESEMWTMKKLDGNMTDALEMWKDVYKRQDRATLLDQRLHISHDCVSL